jgi:signal transduction histidine kinase
MSHDDRQSEERVVVLAPTEKDALRSRSVLAEVGLACAICPSLEVLCRELRRGVGAVVLTEESLAEDGERQLAEALARQPAWSELPILVLTGGGADSPLALRALETLGNVTLLERPVRLTALTSALRAALRARRRQYQVRDHLEERERTAAALREAARRKDEFLAMLAHELRNPLAPIRTGLQILRLRCKGNAVVEQVGGMMERQLSHMVRLVDDLLDVSRIARGKIELRKERVELAAVVARAVEGVRPALEERQHHLEAALPAEPVWLDADPARLEQVLANLLTNACKYTEPGGHIHLAGVREGDEVVLRVRDDGIGIRPEMLTHIFEMFAQADRVPGRLLEGLGLGLSLVKSLAEMHGGTATAFSEGPGRGSEFVVRLPAPDGAGVGAGVRPSASAPVGRPLRVLIVDDNEDAARSLGALLHLLGGHEVRLAHDGPAALTAVREFQPEAVLLDIGLPRGMNGYEVARRLRQEAGAEAPFLVAVTGYGQEEDRRRSREAGFDAHVVKPVAPEVVQEMLARVGGRR